MRKNTWGAGTSGPSFPPPRPPTLLPSSCSAAEFARFLRMNEWRCSPGQRRTARRASANPRAKGFWNRRRILQSQESLFLLGNTVSTTVSGPNVTHRFVGRGSFFSFYLSGDTTSSTLSVAVLLKTSSDGSGRITLTTSPFLISPSILHFGMCRAMRTLSAS